MCFSGFQLKGQKLERKKKAIQFLGQDKQRMEKKFEIMIVGIKVMFNFMVELR